jgi:molybdopterin-dependent oxidoreductase alpha subunit
LESFFSILKNNISLSMKNSNAQQGNLEQQPTASYAAGIQGVAQAVKHVFGAMPVGRGIKTLLKLNQKNGIDCPSCAWPDPDGHRSAIGEYCENGAKAIADEATTRKVTLPFFQKYSVADLAQKSDYWLGQQGRLTAPMLLNAQQSHYEEISWQQAFELIGKELNSLSSPSEAIFYTSGRSSNEAAYLYQLFARAFGTNNLPDCSNMCHESSGVALGQTIGIGKGTVTLADFDQAEVIIVMGQNPGTNHPRMLSSLEAAAQKGAKIVTINPLLESGLLAFANPQKVMGLLGKPTKLSHSYLQLKINTDLALIKAVIKILFTKYQNNEAVFDTNFVKQKTADFEALSKHFDAIDANELITETGLDAHDVYQLAELLVQKNKIIVCWAMGLTQHRNAVATIREIVNLLLLKGAVGKPGAGLCPVRGHSNVQGDRTMGIIHKNLPKLNAALKHRYGFAPPEQNGYDVVEAIEAMYQQKAKVFVALGGNFLSAAPDTQYTAQALQNCNLTVHISTKLNRSHLVTGRRALILPCLGRTDMDLQGAESQYLTTENSMGVVQPTKGVLRPVSGKLLSEPAIVAGIAQATLANKYGIPWASFAKNYSLIRAEIQAVIAGFDNFEQKVMQSGGFYLPNAPRQGVFETDSTKAHFTINNWEKSNIASGAFTMMTIRSHDQFNTTVYGLNDRYRGIYNHRRVVFMNTADMATYNLQTYQLVNLVNKQYGTVRLAEQFVVVPYTIPLGCIATYFPEANVLVPLQHVALESGTPASKSVEVFVEKI